MGAFKLLLLLKDFISIFTGKYKSSHEQKNRRTIDQLIKGINLKHLSHYELNKLGKILKMPRNKDSDVVYRERLRGIIERYAKCPK